MTKNISPHVTIYKFPVTAISSIATRITGVYLSGLFVAGGISKLIEKDKYLCDKYSNLNSNLKTAFHYSIIFPSVYHTYGGIRHFIWDKYPKLLNNKSVAKSSFILFGLSSLTSILTEKLINKNI